MMKTLFDPSTGPGLYDVWLVRGKGVSLREGGAGGPDLGDLAERRGWQVLRPPDEL